MKNYTINYSNISIIYIKMIVKGELKMNLVVKKFEELTTKELYEILKARIEIFVVEQNCIYQDLDDIDYNSFHIFYEQDGKVIAYLRAFTKKDNESIIQIGRVLTIEHGNGLGKKILEASIHVIKDKTNANKIFMEAQKYASGFYEKFGFKITSDEFLEDGIPHVNMELEL